MRGIGLGGRGPISVHCQGCIIVGSVDIMHMYLHIHAELILVVLLFQVTKSFPRKVSDLVQVNLPRGYKVKMKTHSVTAIQCFCDYCIQLVCEIRPGLMMAFLWLAGSCEGG